MSEEEAAEAVALKAVATLEDLLATHYRRPAGDSALGPPPLSSLEHWGRQSNAVRARMGITEGADFWAESLPVLAISVLCCELSECCEC